MRIVGGSLRGRRLEAPPSSVTRPTGDRVRESLFNVLENLFQERGLSYNDVSFLDAFAGSGALGIESLSRGGSAASFIEQNNGAYQIIKDNVLRLGLEKQVKTYRRDALKPGAPHLQHQVVFLDPPYGKNLSPKALKALDKANWLTQTCFVVLELGQNEQTPLLEGFTFLDRRLYGTTHILFFAREPVNQKG